MPFPQKRYGQASNYFFEAAGSDNSPVNGFTFRNRHALQLLRATSEEN